MVIKFKITDDKDGCLSKDIDKLIKQERSKKTEKPETFVIKGERNF